MEDKKKTSIHPAVGIADGETRRTPGFCGKCNKETVTIWVRSGWALKISCEECRLCYWWFENRFKPEEDEKKEAKQWRAWEEKNRGDNV